jgi:hypothetical protein
MKTIFLILLFTISAYSQIEIIDEPYLINNTDTLITSDFEVGDSVQLFLAVNDTCDVDVYVEYSYTGLTWNRTAKLLDIDVNASIDTSLFYSALSIPKPVSRMRFWILFAASGNSTNNVGKIMAYIKRFPR